MFSNTPRGATASAELYSVIETAKANGVEPLKYIQRLLEELPKRQVDDSVEYLMPWNVQCSVWLAGRLQLTQPSKITHCWLTRYSYSALHAY